MRRLFIAGVWLVGLAGFVVLAFARDTLSRRTAQAASEEAAVWVFTPYVGPGETLHGEVKAWRGIALGITRVQARIGDESVVLRGRGHHWGRSLTTQSNTRGADDAEFALALPADLPEGQPIRLTVDVEYAYAARAFGGFQNSKAAETLTVELPLHGAAARVALRLWSGLRGLLGFALMVLIYLRFGPRLGKDGPHTSESEAQGLAYLMICVGVFIAMAGYPLFAQPLMAATGWIADGFVIGAMVIWIIAPPLIAWQIHKRRPKTAPWTLRFAAGSGAADPATVIRLLEMRAGLTVRRGRHGFTVRRDRRRFVRVRLGQPGRFEPTIGAEVSDRDLLFEVALAIVEKSGPLTLVTQMVELPVDRHATAQSLDADYQAQVQAALERLAASIFEIQAGMDRLGLGRKP